MLTRKYVYEAEVNAIKKKRQAEKINLSLEKINPALSKKLKEQKQAKAKPKQEWGKPKRSQSTKQTPKVKAVSPDKTKLQKPVCLNKEEQLIKDKLIAGGQFDAIGDKFARNRK